MEFWIIVGVITLFAGATLALAARRGGANMASAAAYDVQVYRDQLKEIERDVARGVLSPEDATRTRTEVARRILAADAAAQDEATARAVPARFIGASALGLVLLCGSIWLYANIGAPGYGDLSLAMRVDAAETMRQSRPDQVAAETGLSPGMLPEVGEINEDYLVLVERLRQVVAERPNDLQGYQLLAVSERNLGNFAAARAAYEQYVLLMGDDAGVAEFSDLADIMILAAGGYVSPEAEMWLARALEVDPANGPARYYWGLMRAQTARPDLAFRIWDTLLREGPASAAWIPPIQAQIDEMALRAGINYTQPTPGGMRGPSADDIEAAGEMSIADRMEMIEGMVAGLSERLATDGGPPDEWARLITSLSVLGRREDALAVYWNAKDVFAESPSAIDIINRAGQQAGVAN